MSENSNTSNVQLPGIINSILGQWADDIIERVNESARFLGITTTAITDGSTVSTIVIDGQSVSVSTGDIAVYSGNYFLFYSSAWHAGGGGGPSSIAAEDVSYDNTTSGLTATDVQASTDEIVDILDDKLSYTELTQAEYDVLVEDEEVDPDVAYMITDRNQSGGTYASGVIYDNTDSGLDATNVQNAIDELAETGGGAGVSVLTYAEYQELVAAGEVNPDISYYISDSNTTGTNYAAGISYDNTESGMAATDVQEAIDEIAPVKSSIGNIDNVTLTTSDNNKLLGSFVENNEVVVRAVGSESVSITFNSSQSDYTMPYNNTHVEKFGNVVSVCIVPKCANSYSTYPGQLVYTGLPAPKQALYYTFNSPLGGGKIRLMIDTSGNLYLRWGNVNDEYDCTFTYVCW